MISLDDSLTIIDRLLSLGKDDFALHGSRTVPGPQRLDSSIIEAMFQKSSFPQKETGAAGRAFLICGRLFAISV
jgi:hypothetical protein